MRRRDGLGPATRTLVEELRVGCGDPEAWNTLLLRLDRHYFGPLRTYLAGSGVPASEVEDVLDRIRLSLVKGRLQKYDPQRGGFRSWLIYSVGRDHLRDWRRKARPARTVPLPVSIASTAGLDGESPEEGWEVSCIAHALLDSLVHLLESAALRGGRRSERIRDIVTAVWVEGKATDEVARNHGILRATVRYHLRRARRRLLATVLDELRERDLGGGPFEAHCRRLREKGAGEEVDFLVRGASRYLLDRTGSPASTTRAIRDRISGNGGAGDPS